MSYRTHRLPRIEEEGKAFEPKGINYYAAKAHPTRELPNGMTYCKKHPTTFYDPRKYEMCYYCYRQKQNER